MNRLIQQLVRIKIIQILLLFYKYKTNGQHITTEKYINTVTHSSIT